MKRAILSMGLLLSLGSLLLITVVEGRPNKIPPSESGEAMAYWQKVIPNSPMPPAIIDLMSPQSKERDNKKFDSTAVGKGHNKKLPSTEKVNYDWKFPIVYYASKEVGGAKEHMIAPSKEGDDKFTSRTAGKGQNSKLESIQEVNYDWKFPLVYYASKEVGDIEGADKKFISRVGGKVHEKNHSPTEEVNYDWKFPLVYYASKEVGDIEGYKGEKLEHVHSNSGDNAPRNSNGIFLFEDELIPGSVLTARVASSSPYRPPLLSREIAESIPLSSENFTEILTMFAPASLSMVDDIKFTLSVCEDPRHVKGERRQCASSVESMVDLVANTLGTRDVRAMSSNVPVEGMPTRQYRLAAVRRATGSHRMMTCHGMRYPYMVFMCHSIYPSRAYYVTLATDDGLAPTEAMVMCHLDTSSWAPDHYFFQFTGAKPGEKAACHFINRDTIVWAPAAAGNQGEVQAAAE